MAVVNGFPNAGRGAPTNAGENRDPVVLGNGMNRQRSDSSELGVAVLESLDWLNLGVALTDSSGKLLLANRTAKQLLDSRDGLELMPGGAIGTVKRNCGRTLRVA